LAYSDHCPLLALPFANESFEPTPTGANQLPTAKLSSNSNYQQDDTVPTNASNKLQTAKLRTNTNRCQPTSNGKTFIQQQLPTRWHGANQQPTLRTNFKPQNFEPIPTANMNTVRTKASNKLPANPKDPFNFYDYRFNKFPPQGCL
jgi:hypothetical protein